MVGGPIAGCQPIAAESAKPQPVGRAPRGPAECLDGVRAVQDLVRYSRRMDVAARQRCQGSRFDKLIDGYLDGTGGVVQLAQPLLRWPGLTEGFQVLRVE